jgi:N-acyl-D-aspartate/D-glutamate deacylase
MVATFNYATVILEHLVRREQLMTLEEAIHRLTSVQAQLYGIRDRGELALPILRGRARSRSGHGGQ